MFKISALLLYAVLATCWAQQDLGRAEGGGINSKNAGRGKGHGGNRYKGRTLVDRTFKYNVAYDDLDERDYALINQLIRGFRGYGHPPGYGYSYGYPGAFGYGPIGGYGTYGPQEGAFGSFGLPQDPINQFHGDYENGRRHSGLQSRRFKKRGKHSKLNLIDDTDDDY